MLPRRNQRGGPKTPGCSSPLEGGWSGVISVVVPAYNAERHIARSLSSVLSQTYQEFEVIVVDDGSRDQTAAIVESFSDPRIQLIQQPNKGVSAARNRGVEVARGGWVAFIDSDDEWEPTFLERVVDARHQFPNAVAVFTNFRDSVTGKPMIPDVSGPPRLLTSYFSFVLENGQGMWSSCVLIHRDVLIKVGGFPVGITHGEDVDTWARLAWTGPIVYVPEVLAIYHTETEGSAMKIPIEKWWSYPPVVETFNKWKSEGRILASMLAASELYAQRHLYAYVGGLLKIGDRYRARETLLRECAVRVDPIRYFGYLFGSLLPTRAYRHLLVTLMKKPL